MSEEELPLSPAGQARREQILALALETSRRRRQSRMAVRGMLVCAGIAIAFSAAYHIQQQNLTPSIVISTAPTVPSPTRPVPEFIKLRGSHPIVIARIKTDARISSQLQARPNTISIDRLSDDQLLEQLALDHQSAGLARIGGKPMLLLRRGD